MAIFNTYVDITRGYFRSKPLFAVELGHNFNTKYNYVWKEKNRPGESNRGDSYATIPDNAWPLYSKPVGF